MARSADDDGVSLGKGKTLKVTEKALLIQTEDHGNVWVPRSVVHDDSEVFDRGHEGDLVVQSWCAEKEGYA
jgi:hypothetical protein